MAVRCRETLEESLEAPSPIVTAVAVAVADKE